MQFANPSAFLLLLLLIPLALAKGGGDMLARARLRRIAGPRLLPNLRRGGWRGRGVLVFLCEALALTGIIVALARPQWGYVEEEIPGEGRSILIAIDTSRSMLVDDLHPNRLTRAKLAAQDLIARLPGDRIGLIAFAGRAFLQAPLTTDHEALIETLDQFDAELIPRGGSNLGEPIELAIETFSKAGTASHALILFSDGDELEGDALALARKAREQNIMIVSVGVGTPEGALVPDDHPRNRGGYIRDPSGRPVRSRLEERVLEGLARETGGLYLNISTGAALRDRVELVLSKLDRVRTQAQKDKRRAIDRFQWALLPGMGFLVLAFLLRLGRRLPAGATVSHRTVLTPVLRVMPLLFAATASSLQAGLILPGKRSALSPWQLYEQQKYEEAAAAFAERLREKPAPQRAGELEMGLGAAAMRQQDFDTAIDAFGRALASPDPALQAEASYNLGNALAEKAKHLPKMRNRVSAMIDLIEQALPAYDEALRVRPDHTAARENREALAQFLEQLKQYREQLREQARQRRQQQQESDQQEGEENQEDGEGEQQSSEGQQPEGQQPGGGGQSSDQGQGQEEGDVEDLPEDEEPGEDEGTGEEEGPSGGGEQSDQQQSEEGSGQGGGSKSGQGAQSQQAAPDDHEAERRGEQAEGERLEAKEGERPPSSRRQAANDRRRQRESGFSRSEARALLKALSDEDHVRPLLERGPPEGSYKNW